MSRPPEPIGSLFPLGGPVPSDLIIGRRGEIDEISGRLREGVSTMLAGERRIGKTTVCSAVCGELKSQGALVIEVDVPERADSRALLQLLFLDELQRVVDYADGETVLCDLIDLYGASGDAVVLVDGSNERALNGMFGAPVHFGKLVDRIELDARIPLTSWREPLTERFSRAALLLEDAPREELLKWGDGRPYATMAAARYTAQSARRTSSDIATEFDVQMGIDEAERHLRDDGA